MKKISLNHSFTVPSVFNKNLVCAVFAAVLLSGCGDDSDKNNNNGAAEPPECTSNQQCADRTDNKTECDPGSQRCVVPSSNTVKCGNGIIEASEACDGLDLNQKSCTDFDGFIGGTLACNQSCSFDKSGCFECTDDDLSKCTGGQICSSGHCVEANHQISCGDELVEGSEQCDGSNLNDKTCADISGFVDGELGCNACAFDTARCVECTNTIPCADGGSCQSGVCVTPVNDCGNGRLDEGESCDSDNLDNKQCQDWPEFIGGTLACSSTCGFDLSGCMECSDSDKTKCQEGEKCSGGRCIPDNLEELCSDNDDNDNDGDVDCDDDDCKTLDICKTIVINNETCSDKTDNDNDGDVDCDDDDCKTLDICKTIEINNETCSDKADNDNDGDVDCDDDDCKTLDICKTIVINKETCSDNIDNDNDGNIDCKDSDCAAFCPTVTCGDNQMYVPKIEMCAYKISNAGDLISLRDTWNASGAASYNSPGPVFALADDIALGSISGWVGIGTEDKPFTGVLIGNDKTISGTLKCTDDCGLFDVMYTAVVADLKLSLNVSTNSAFAGLMASLAQSITAYNITLSGSVTSAQIAGGFSAIGSGEYKNITDNANVKVNSSAVNGTLSVGGLVGYVVPSTEMKLENIEMDVSVDIYNHFVAVDPGVPLRYSGCVLGLMEDGQIEMNHANIKCRMSSDIFGDEPDSPCNLMSYLTGYFGGIAASIKASGKLEDIWLDFTPNEIFIKGDAFGGGVCTRWVKVSNYFGGFFAEANGLSASDRLELNRASCTLRNAKITASTGAERDYSAPLASTFNNAVARNFVVDAVSSRALRSAVAYRVENSSIANFNVGSVSFEGMDYFDYVNKNSAVVNGYVSGIDKNDEMNVNNYYSILYSGLNSLYVLNSDRKMVDGSAYSASQVAEFFNGTLESKHSSFPSGKYLPWYVDGDGNPSLNFDAADTAMYTIP